MEIEAREINDLKKELYEIISKNTGQKYDKVYKDGDRDYWMTSKDALDYGMIDKIIKSKK
jgi:ATP-dependent Clp protease protease subunit